MQGAFDTIPHVVLRKMELTYSEPMTLKLRQRPEGIEVLRVVSLVANQEIPVKCGTAVHYVWRPDVAGAQITSIDGMSMALNGAKQYRFTFRITYEGA